MDGTSATQRPDVRHVWRGASQLVVDTDGWAGGEALTGYWFRQTRFLRELRLRIDGQDVHPCSIAEASAAGLECTFVHPEVTSGGGGGSGSGGTPSPGGLLFRDIDVQLRYRVRPASLHIDVRLTSRWQDDVAVDVSWLVSSDFATVEQAVFGETPPAGSSGRAVEGGVAFRCNEATLGLEARVDTRGADFRYVDGRLIASVRLARQRPHDLQLTIRAIDPTAPIEEEGEALREQRLEQWSEERMRIGSAGDTEYVAIAERAADDLGSLALLEGEPDEWLAPAAGVPLYQALWARDALTATWQAGILDGGDMVRDVVTLLARVQGTAHRPELDEQPGRILNQSKADLRARTGQSAFALNYADVASPFMFIIGMGHHFALTDDRAFLAAHFDAAVRVIDWARQYGDRDGDGYIEYLTTSREGPKHQGWKDSENAVVGADGEQVSPPIAPCETQGYYYAALLFMAGFALVLGETDRSAEYWSAAAELKERFNRDFWMEDEGYLAFGLDADKRPIRALTSNAAQCLATGIVATDHIARLARRMFEPDLFSGWGIRTLSSLNPAYNPLDYHLGTVWPVENASIVFGLRRYGLNDRAEQLITALYDLARLWPDGRTPECVGGYARDELAHPGAYPRANRPQLWNQSVWPLVTQSMLGLVPVAPAKLLLVDPMLPEWLPELTVRGLRVGDARVTLRFARDAHGRQRWKVQEKEGRLRVVQQPWIESFSADMWDRARMLLRTATTSMKR